MNDKVKVEVMVEGRCRWTAEVEMTAVEYAEWCERIAFARGMEETDAAEELLDLANVDIARDMDITEMRVEDFIEA